jgi:uncharacterized protein (DUF1330 family)
MKAYLISQAVVTDPEAWERYREIAAPAIAQHGGRYLVRGASPEVIEGDWTPPDASEQQIIVAEFPNLEALHAWYASPEYAEALVFRERAVTRRLLFVEGVSQ